MPNRKLNFPVFDVDNHMYETPDALTKFLPAEYQDVIQYVLVNGRTKIAVKGQISNYIPNPTFNKVAPPGAMEIEFKLKNPSSKVSAEDLKLEPPRGTSNPHRRSSNPARAWSSWTSWASIGP